MGLLAYIPTNVLATYLTLVLRSIGFTTFQANLLAIPNFVLHILLLLGLTWSTEKCNNRLGLSLLQPLYTVPLLAVLRFWKGTMFNKWGTYAIITLILDNSVYPCNLCILVF